jgi:hypothetical protein
LQLHPISTPPALACLVQLADECLQAGHLQHNLVRRILHLPGLQHSLALGLQEQQQQ